MKTLAAMTVLLSLSGCASIYSVAVDPAANDIYGGVRLDSRIIGAAATNGGVGCGLEDCHSPHVWMLASGAICDLPFSLVGDTVLLPYTVVAAGLSAAGD